MYYLVVAAIMLFMINIEATIFSIIFPLMTSTNSFAVPNLAIIVLTFVCLIRDDKKIVILAFVIGFFKDVVFGYYIGLYAFSYAFIAYWANITFRIFIDRHVVVFIVSVILAMVSFELLVWGINTLFGIIDVSFMQAFDRYFWGSLLLGSSFAAILYGPIIAMLERRGVSFYE